MKSFQLLILSVAVVFHFLMLYLFGIAWFGSTIIFYYLLYIIFSIPLNLIAFQKYKKIISKNIQILLIILLFIEFIMTFVTRTMNNYMENEKYIYFSEYMRSSQIKLLHELGWSDLQIAWENGYKPYSIREHKTKEFHNSFTCNSLGLRGDLPKKNKDSNEYRIIVLGDSFVEGYGAPNDSTFPVLLQFLLNKNNKKTSVINAGICGSNPIYEIILYKKKLRVYHPDLVLLQINLTDLSDMEYAFHQNHMSIHEFFYAVSHIYRCYFNGVFNANINNSNASNRTKQRRLVYLNYLINELFKFNAELKKDKIALAVIYTPVISELERNKRRKAPTGALINTLRNSGLQYIDLKEEYEKELNYNLDLLKMNYWINDGHFNSNGYLFMAKKISKKY